MVNYFRTIDAPRSREGTISMNMSSPRSGFHAPGHMTSGEDFFDEQTAVASLNNFVTQYKPMLSGTLSSNPNTGRVQVDYDKSTMSIVIRQDNQKKNFVKDKDSHVDS